MTSMPISVCSTYRSNRISGSDGRFRCFANLWAALVGEDSDLTVAQALAQMEYNSGHAAAGNRTIQYQVQGG